MLSSVVSVLAVCSASHRYASAAETWNGSACCPPDGSTNDFTERSMERSPIDSSIGSIPMTRSIDSRSACTHASLNSSYLMSTSLAWRVGVSVVA